MAKISVINDPEGWLTDPNKKWTMHFEKSLSPNSKESSEITLDMWRLMPNRAPSQFKSRRKLPFQEASKIWNELISLGWKKTKNRCLNIA